jgi:hypothetical protein
MASDEKQAHKWLRAFKAQLPVTESAMSQALSKMFHWAEDILNGQRDIEDERVDVIDATILAAIAEGAVIDGDLRRAIEDLLGQTLWYAGANAATREQLLERALRRAQYVVGRVGFDKWSMTFYRSGLPVRSCLALRDVLTPSAASIYSVVVDTDGDHDGVLLWLASKIAPVVSELAHWRDVAASDLEGALRMWLSGERDENIEANFNAAWDAIRPSDLDTLVPWILTSAIDVITTELGKSDFREIAHWRLAPVRLRYGVPRSGMCELVRDGFDRDDAIAIANEFQQASPEIQVWGLRQFAEQWRREREAGLDIDEGDEPF